jgi:hypothetical protein
MTPRVRVNARALLNAVQDSTPDVVYFVDSQKGDVLKVTRSMNLTELARFKQQADRDPDRFLKVPKPTGEETYGDMEAFRASLKDKKLQDRLRLATTGGGTLRNFLDTLNPVPQERDRWYKFRESRILGRLGEWLRQNGLSLA